MAQPSPNDIMRDYYRAMGEGDFERVVSLHDPDVTCWMSGTSLVSGRFEQRDQLYAHMAEHVLGLMVADNEQFVKGTRLVIADGDYGVGLMHGGLPMTDGSRYNQFYIQVFRFEHGLIREIVELFDTVMVETVLMKNALETPRPLPDRPFDIDGPGLTSALDRAGAVALAGRFSGALKAADFTSAAACLADGAEIRVIGSTPFSGRTTDPGILQRVFARGLTEVRVVGADGGAAVVLAKAGGDYAQQYAILLEMQGEAIGCVSLFFDTAAAEIHEFGNRFVPATSTSIKPPFDVSLAFAMS